ncbi:Guanine nucleotide exchange factor lte1 [Scheffersomyces spartinae]|uniref:Guanine nucleotide exchange factor lte1 n=1 Tax=Scheffersomyces spartinae TaxID=45513 RepID=A0A9P7V859_9ASCO|nr:Guanine nucleotide exchange factor lte1 [Scheffersomyces spartinae]KAG7192651.1 Guanine nucleotide exchange factor lte1 [Scheffersomyces spartinae]
MNVILVGTEGVSDPLDSDQEHHTPYADHLGPEMEKLNLLSPEDGLMSLDNDSIDGHQHNGNNVCDLDHGHNDDDDHDDDIEDDVHNDENIFNSPKKEYKIGPAYTYNKHNESMFDEERLFPFPHPSDLIKFDEHNPELVNQATLKALVVQLTSPEVIDYNLVCDFFLTYRVFIDADRVMAMLITRLYWALQYINSTSQDNINVGKLTLLRTFVVLRHWIINYFVDDFDNNTTLCNYFVTNLNKITAESNLVTDSMLFEKKILGDLKIHWLNQIRDFWGFTYSPEDVHSNILQYIIPLEIQTKKLSKSNTEMSIHTNPSFRRSAMLSLYDLKSHHKMIIFDDNQRPMDNPQYCINNLLLQHHSSSSSLNEKLKGFQDRSDPSPIFNASPQFGGFQHNSANLYPKKLYGASTKNIIKRKKHNHLNLTNSSLSLKKTTKIFESSTSLLKDSPSRLDATGFSTNGKIKVPTSKVESILPPTPVKKMDYVLNLPQSNSSEKVSAGPGTKNNNKGLVRPVKPSNEQEEVVRSRSLKKIMGNWKKSFTNHRANGGATTETELLDMMAGSPMGRSVSTTSMSESSILMALTTINNKPSSIHATTSDLLDGSRVDILSARLIDELEYLIRFYMNHSKRNTQLDEVDTSPLGSHPEMDEECKSLIGPNSPKLNQKEVFVENDVQMNDYEEETSELDIVHMSDLITPEIDHDPDNDDSMTPETLVDSKDTSFQNPTNINWNDENELNLENLAEYSQEIVQNSDELMRVNSKGIQRITKTATQYFDVSDAFNEPKSGNESVSFGSSISSPSRYDAEVQDLGIAVSPEQNVRTISFNEMNLVANRMSIISKNSSFKRDSMKSYLSYDSAFSSSSPAATRLEDNKENEYGLRKKTGFNNLRAGNKDQSELRIPRTTSTKTLDIPFNVRASVGSALSKSSSLRKSVRFTCLALNELPFSDNFELNSQLANKSHSLLSGGSMKKKSLAHLMHMSTRLSDIADSSIFSVSLRAIKQNKDSGTSNSNVAIPGISSGVLKELASIPDESFQMTDPVEFALYKLEGKHSLIYDIENHRFEEQMKHKVEYIQRLQDDSYFNEQEDEDEPEEEDDEEPKRVILKDAESNGTYNSSEAELIFQAGAKAEDFKDSGGEEEEESDADEAINIDHFAPRTVEEEMQYEVTPHNESSMNTQEDTQDILNAINAVDTQDISHDNLPNITQEVPPLVLKSTKGDTPVLCSTPNASMSEDSNKTQENLSNRNSQKESPRTVLDSYQLSKDIFSTDNVLEANRHISFVLSYGSKALADHFTLIERDMLQEIDWKELIELKWNKELTPVNSWLEVIINDSYYTGYRGVTLVIARFNLMVNWIISECLLTKYQSERIHLISRLIHVAQNCYTLQNYSTLMQIILALTSEKVQRMKETWKSLPPGDILMLKNLEELASPIKNFLNIRLSINQIKPSKGCVPFVGLYLSDLIFNEERPTFVKSTIAPNHTGSSNKESTTINTSSLAPPNMSSMLATEVASTVSTIDSDNDNLKLINFSKYRTSVHIVKSLSQCIEWSNSYDIQVNPELLSKCLYIKSLDEDEMNYCLSHIEN